jgi:hypothetical protein
MFPEVNMDTEALPCQPESSNSKSGGPDFELLAKKKTP